MQDQAHSEQGNLISRVTICSLVGSLGLGLLSSELEPLLLSKNSPGVDDVWPSDISGNSIPWSILSSGLGGLNSWGQAKAGYLGEGIGQGVPTSEEQAGGGTQGAFPFGGTMLDLCDVC